MKEFHLIQQPYIDPHPERNAEIWDCFLRNVRNPYVTQYHCMLEPGVEIPANVMSWLDSEDVQNKLVLRTNQPRMTFRNAIQYSTQYVPDGHIFAIVNGDIYLSDRHDWRTILDQQPYPRFLTRWEIHPVGLPSMIYDSLFEGYSADTWIFPTPVTLPLNRCTFRVGNHWGCDAAMANIMKNHYKVVINDPVAWPTYHVDKCAHRGRLIFGGYTPALNSSTEVTEQQTAEERAMVDTINPTCAPELLCQLQVCTIHRQRVKQDIPHLAARHNALMYRINTL